MPDELGPIGQAAVAYAEMGWSIIALHGVNENGSCTCSAGSACSGAGKHPRSLKWQQNATANAEMIAGQWSHYGERANVGIVAGPSGLVIVDIDGDAGLETFGRLTGGEFSTPYTVKTGNGWHLYFSADVEHSLRPYVGTGEMAGLDLRAGNSFVVAPPSRHKSGGMYLWK